MRWRSPIRWTFKEGPWPPGRVIVLEFPTQAAAQAWYADVEYQPLLLLRGAISDGKLAPHRGRGI
ncbi:MAG: DUF1330 domain-containing protein [Proteobacteria bacterium]|nr:MAG: DUF1330 domain-containing protein [Pseudomonadota bacterium]